MNHVDILGGMPGDEVTYNECGELKKGVIRSAGWSPTPNGGKVWAYELCDDVKIPALQVKLIKKAVAISEEMAEQIGKPLAFSDERVAQIVLMLEDIILSSSLKTAVFCVLQNDVKNLEIAKHLIETHLRNMTELA